jgi:hypothetical protein
MKLLGYSLNFSPHHGGMLRYPLYNLLLISCLLISCQTEQKSPVHSSSAAHLSIDSLTVVKLPRSLGPASSAQPVTQQTLYPDTLHPRALAYHVWTTAEVDTMQGKRLPVADAQYRVLDVHNTLAYGGGPYLRFFYRLPRAPARWLELDLGNPLGEFLTDLYLQPQTVDLDQRSPAELLLRLGGRNDGNAAGMGLGYTLLLSLAGPPTVIWQSVDDCEQTIRPLLTEADSVDTEESSFTRGYREDEAHRRITVRRGLVQVSRISYSATDSLGKDNLTPITPGHYRYRQGRFQRIVKTIP